MLQAYVRHESEGLFVLTPAATVPGSLYVLPVRRIAHRLAWRAMRRRLPGLEPGHVDVVVGGPPALDLACWLRPRRLIYDCLDLFPQWPRKRWLDWASAHFALVEWKGILRYLLPMKYYLHVPTRTFSYHTPAIILVGRKR